MVIFIRIALTYDSVIMLMAVSFLHHNAHNSRGKASKGKETYLCIICNYLAFKDF